MKDVGGVILGMLIVGFIGVMLRLLLTSLSAGASAVVRTATGRGTLSSNFKASMFGMSALEYQLRETRLSSSGEGPLLHEVQMKGLFPISRAVRLGALTHVYDAETKLPLMCALEQFQEPETIVFQFKAELGVIRPNQGLTDWVRVGVVLPEIMMGPYGGRRRLDVIVRFIDLDNPPPIRVGVLPSSHPGLLWVSRVLTLSHEFKGQGFHERSQEEELSLAAAVRVAVFMAMADGELHESEGAAIKAWMVRTLSGLNESRRSTMRDRLNSAFKAAYEQAKSSELDLHAALAGLKDVENVAIKYQILQLAFDVLAADGCVDSSEIGVINQIASALDLDVREVERIRDQKLIGLGTEALTTVNANDVLGLKPGWDRETIQRHLRGEFQKWNGRLNSLADGPERQNAQRMLDLIAEARKKHA